MRPPADKCSPSMRDFVFEFEKIDKKFWKKARFWKKWLEIEEFGPHFP